MELNNKKTFTNKKIVALISTYVVFYGKCIPCCKEWVYLVSY